jgi:hypothetical protein
MKLAGAGIAIMLAVGAAHSEPIPVKHALGAERGFLVVRSETGKLLGDGELIQYATGDEVHTTLTFRFLDGSVDEETTVFRQRGTFQLVRDRHVQQGPFFKDDTDITVDVPTGMVTIKTTSKKGESKTETNHMDLPSDVANGMVGSLVLNVNRDAAFSVGMVATTSKGRLIKLDFSSTGEQSFRIAGRVRKATVFRIHPDLGGVAAVIAPIIDKQPKDIMLWVLEGDVPSFIREVGQLSEGGPIVSIEFAGTSFGMASRKK